MGKVEVQFADPATFKGQKAAQTFKRQKNCCNDIIFALLFVANLVCVGWLAGYAHVEGKGFDHSIQSFSNVSEAMGNETVVLFGVDLGGTSVWKEGTSWLVREFALVERDVERNYDLMAMTGVVGLCLGLVWLQLLKRLTSCMVHLTLFLVVVVTAALGFVVYHYSEGCLVNLMAFESQKLGCVDLQQLTETESDTLRGAAYVIWGISGVLALCILILKSKIALTVAIFSEACRGCLTNIGIYPVTIVIVIALCSFQFFWLNTLMYLYSIPADDVMSGMMLVEQANISTRVVLLYMVFCYLWVCAFLGAVFHASIAGIVGSWYFNRHHVSTSSPLTSSWVSLWHNLTVSCGSLAFGSLILGIVSFLRYLLKKAEAVSKRQPALATVFKCCKCCLCCIEKFVEMISQYAYVYVAMEHCGFCAGAKKSFKLVSKYPVQMVVMKAINGFVLLCGKCMLTIVSVLFFLFTMDQLERDFCTLFIVLCTLVLFQIFRFQANIIGAAADTIFVCYVMDLNLNDGEAVHMQSSAGLHERVQAAVTDYERENPMGDSARLRLAPTSSSSATFESDTVDDPDSPLTPCDERVRETRDETSGMMMSGARP